MTFRRFVDGIRKLDKRISRFRSNERRILVDARTAMNSAVIAPIVRAMEQDARLTFYFTSSANPKQARKIFSGLSSERIISPRSASLMRFDAYLAADLMWAWLPRGSRRVLFFHGVAGKYSNLYDAPDRSMRHWDRILFINQKRMNNFIASGAIDADSPSARLVGYPKLDALVDGCLNRDEILMAMGLNPQLPTILYAPTWSEYSSLNSIGVELINALCAVPYQVIVKLHDRSWTPIDGSSLIIDWATRLEPILNKSGGRLVKGSDLTTYLAAADVMITDHSSGGFEYLLVDRPLIRIEIPELIAKTNIPDEYVSLLARASTTANSIPQILQAIKHGLENPLANSPARKAVASELFYEPGSATVRAVDELYEVIELTPPANR